MQEDGSKEVLVDPHAAHVVEMVLSVPCCCSRLPNDLLGDDPVGDLARRAGGVCGGNEGAGTDGGERDREGEGGGRDGMDSR